jgi:hypothetical protein
MPIGLSIKCAIPPTLLYTLYNSLTLALSAHREFLRNRQKSTQRERERELHRITRTV